MESFEYVGILFGIWYVVVVTSVTYQTNAFQNNAFVVNTMSQSKFLLRYRKCVQSQQRIRPYLPLSSTASSTSSDLLEGKLSILQDVVKEMDARQKQIQDKTESTSRVYEESLRSVGKELDESRQITMIQEEKIKGFEKEFFKIEEKHATSLEQIQARRNREYEEQNNVLSDLSDGRLDRVKKEYDNHVVHLEDQLEKKQKEIDELSSKLTTKSITSKKTIESLQEDVATQLEQRRIEQDEYKRLKKENENEETLRVKKEMEPLKDRHTKIINEYKIKIDVISSERDILLSESDTITKKSDEQVEIATAAVEAAAKREEKIKNESDDITKQLQRSRLQVKIMRLAMEGLVDENRGLFSKNERLRQDLDIIRDQIAEFDEERNNRKRKWQKLFRFSRKSR
jgi:myosin heavy subunit